MKSNELEKANKINHDINVLTHASNLVSRNFITNIRGYFKTKFIEHDSYSDHDSVCVSELYDEDIFNEWRKLNKEFFEAKIKEKEKELSDI